MIIRKILDYNKEAQKFFFCASKVDKRKSKSKIEESIEDRIKSRGQKLDLIVKMKEDINNKLLSCFFYLNPNIILKKLRDASDEKNKNMVKSINKNLNKMKKKSLKICLKIKNLRLKIIKN